MSRVAEVNVFQFDELSDRAKERARDWFREASMHDDWWDATYEDAIQCAEILGISIRSRQSRVVGSKGERTYSEPCIWFSGFSSQGDGACFEGTYSYAKGCKRAIRRHAPPSWKNPKTGEVETQEGNARLARIADTLTEVQKRYKYSLRATVNHTGHYSHEMCTEFDFDSDIWNQEYGYVRAEDEETVKEALRDFMRWIYRQLETEHDYRNSDEVVDDDIRANEYEFDEDGERWCA